MWRFRKRKDHLPKVLQSIDVLVSTNERKIAFAKQGKAFLLFIIATGILLFGAFLMMLQFYNASLQYSKASWIQVRNLTPIKVVSAPSMGVLDKVFVSSGQLVQKGALLASLRMDDLQLELDETKRKFAEKIVELHCLASLKTNRSIFQLPYDAQLLVDKMTQIERVKYKVAKCERELLKNLHFDQELEEMIAALEDQTRVLDKIVKIRGMIEADLSQEPETDFLFGIDQQALQKAYRDQYFPLMQYAIVQQDLHEARLSYFSRQLEKEKDLSSAIDLTTQEMRYLSQRLRDLDKQMKSNFIYASTTGVIVGGELPQIGFEYAAQEKIFELQPLQSQFQIGIVLGENDASRFGRGTRTQITLADGPKTIGELYGKSAGVFRQSNGQLEALLDLEERAKDNAKAILMAGYQGAGEQRIKANITTGQEKIWHSIRSSINDVIPFDVRL